MMPKSFLLAAVLFAVAAPASAQTKTAAELYRMQCQACHMPDGKSPLEPMNFADGVWKHGNTLKQIEKTIAEGVPATAMLPFKGRLSPQEISALAKYVRAFDKTSKTGAATPPAKPKPSATAKPKTTSR